MWHTNGGTGERGSPEEHTSARGTSPEPAKLPQPALGWESHPERKVLNASLAPRMESYGPGHSQCPILSPVSLPPACSSGCLEKRSLEGNRKHMQMYANESRLLESIWAEAITMNGGLDSTSLNHLPLAPSSHKLLFPFPKSSGLPLFSLLLGVHLWLSWGRKMETLKRILET